jgi:Na+-transporting methylmalonyl-CoA/oxaloacetate decarboxylase gamma subunit
MESIMLALQIYGMGFIIAFLLAVMIKALLYTIRVFSRNKTKNPQHAE